ncbi:two-component system response regulator UvrY [Alteromonadaceae bacterium M269]|nr:two-component system response regulator UvrY [Alteromonadaceae bacterium M269]
MTQILLVDDHDIVRRGIRLILETDPTFEIVGEAENGEEAVKFCRKHNPHVVLMDVSMPGMGGLEATKQILRHCDEVRVIVLSMHKDNPFPAKVMQIGAFGYLTKDAAPEEMIRAIQKVAAGQKYISPELAQLIALGNLGISIEDPTDVLSERELQIMIMITKGIKIPDIAQNLSIAPKTVNTYKYRMYEKLNVKSDVELTHFAVRNNLIGSDKI